MCKGQDEPGGPYRCPGDMQKNLDRATAKLGKATQARNEAQTEIGIASVDMDMASGKVTRLINEPEARWVRNGQEASPQEHVEQMIESGDLSPAAREMNPSDAFEQFREANALDSGEPEVPKLVGSNNPEYEDAERQWRDASRRRNQAFKNKEKAAGREYGARRGMLNARADYDATTRGVGELQASADEARRVSDSGQAKLLDTRIAEATDRINSDAEIRQQKAGQNRGEYTYSPLATGEHSEGDEYYTEKATILVQRDQISGSTKTFHSGSSEAQKRVGGGGSLHVATLTRRDDDGVHSATFKMPVGPDDKEPMTCSRVVQEASERARDHDMSMGSFEQWRTFKDYPSQEEDPQGYQSAKSEYASHGADSKRLREFLGERKYSEYVRG